MCLFVSMLVRNRLQNHAYYGDEAFAGDSVGLGLGQRLDFIFKKGNFGAKSPLTSKILFVLWFNLLLHSNSNYQPGNQVADMYDYIAGSNLDY